MNDCKATFHKYESNRKYENVGDYAWAQPVSKDYIVPYLHGYDKTNGRQ